MSGGGQLGEDQSEIVSVFVDMSHVGVSLIIRRLISECTVDPHGFVEREREH
ncbi:MAG: hypothetical protein ABWX90_03920 [Candidatus Saccharimonadales bacterium]